MDDLKIGIVGLDTSHAVAFTKLLNNSAENHHVKGGKVEIAFPAGSPKVELSMSRIERFTNELRDSFSITIAESIEKVAEESDAILLESVDGGVHLEQLRKIAPFRKPIFIDKPFSLTAEDAREMIQVAKQHETPIMSTSALRFAESLTSVLDRSTKGNIIGADCFGPMEIQEGQPGFFWYGIHSIEILFSVLGKGAKSVSTTTTKEHDVITGVWTDGRIGTVRGNRNGNNQFGAVIHYEEGSEFISINNQQKPFYSSLLEKVIAFFRDGVPRVPLDETQEIIHFIESANVSQLSGKPIFL